MTPEYQSLKDAVKSLADLIGHSRFVASNFDIHYAHLHEAETAFNAASKVLAAPALTPAEKAGVGDGWTVVPEEMTNELIAATTKGRQVLAYENGRFYNAWMEFEASEGGWIWMDDADSEPAPSHYRSLPHEPGAAPHPIKPAQGDGE